MSDHDDFAALLAHLGHLDVHLGYQRTGGIEHIESPGRGFRADALRNAMRREHDGRPLGNLGQFLDEHRALLLQVVDDKFVVDDFVAHIDRRAMLRQCPLHDRDGTVDTRTKTARVGEDDVHARWSFVAGSGTCARRCQKLSTISNAAPTVIALSATLNAGHDQPP